jgi:fibronectin-binding autotransporter adhesin
MCIIRNYIKAPSRPLVVSDIMTMGTDGAMQSTLDENTMNTPSIPITIKSSMTMGTDGTLQIVLDKNKWNSTISFDAGIPVSLGGTLELTFADGTGVLGQLGRKTSLFDWTGVSPTGTFNVTSAYVWDTSRLYTTGDVRLVYASGSSDTKWTGTKNGKWNDTSNWSGGIPTTGAVIEFDAATPANQPYLQNIAGPLRLDGIIFAPTAGTHILSGATLQLSGDSSIIACASTADQYIGNTLELADNGIISVTATGTLSLGGELSGSGSLTKRGSGSLVLANAGTYTGDTVIEDGILALDGVGQIENSAITNDATFQILAGDHTVQSIAGGGETQVLSGSLTVSSLTQDTITLGPGTTLTISALSGGPTGGAITPLPVPEPAAVGLLGAALLSVAALRLFARRTSKQSTVAETR